MEQIVGNDCSIIINLSDSFWILYKVNVPCKNVNKKRIYRICVLYKKINIGEKKKEERKSMKKPSSKN